jgi:hypothetical protein
MVNDCRVAARIDAMSKRPEVVLGDEIGTCDANKTERAFDRMFKRVAPIKARVEHLATARVSVKLRWAQREVAYAMIAELLRAEQWKNAEVAMSRTEVEEKKCEVLIALSATPHDRDVALATKQDLINGMSDLIFKLSDKVDMQNRQIAKCLEAFRMMSGTTTEQDVAVFLRNLRETSLDASVFGAQGQD